MRSETIIIIGYSGHAYVAIEIFQAMNQKVVGYFERTEKQINPYQLKYEGVESDLNAQMLLRENSYFVGVGENHIRGKITENLIKKGFLPTSAIHPTAVLSPSVQLGDGVMIAANATINAQAEIGVGVICNTKASIDHEGKIGNFAHIAPGVTLCGNVTVGEYTLIGANAVVLPNIVIGKNVIVGAGTVVNKNIPDNSKVVGNPMRFISNV